MKEIVTMDMMILICGVLALSLFGYLVYVLFWGDQL